MPRTSEGHEQIRAKEMETWLVTLNTIPICESEQYGRSYSKLEFSVEKNDTADAQRKILAWARGKLRRFRPGKNRVVIIMGHPRLKTGGLDGNRTIRVRHKYSTIRSILRHRPEKLFVVGYGPEAAEELDR